MKMRSEPFDRLRTAPVKMRPEPVKMRPEPVKMRPEPVEGCIPALRQDQRAWRRP